MRRFVPYVVGGLLILAVGLAIVSLWFGNRKPPPSDDADIAAVAKACSVGNEKTTSSNVEASISGYLSKLHSGATVSTQDVGSIAAKIAGDSNGVAMYKDYVNCLQQQMAILLTKRGIVVAPPAGASTPDPDEQAVQRVSMMTPDTPPGTLEDVAGKAISSGAVEDEKGVQLTRYQYKYAIFIADFRLKSQRLGLGLATNKPGKFGDQLDFAQINGWTLEEAAAHCEGGPQSMQET